MSKVKKNLRQAFNALPWGVRRRLMQRVFRFTRSLTLGVRALVWDEAGRVLLVRHTYKEGWMLPGGGVERGETALDALRHELADEVAVHLLHTPRLFAIYANHAIFPNDHVLLYDVRPGTYERKSWQPNDEIAEAAFFAPGDLPAGITPGTHRRIREVIEDLPPATHW